MLNAFFDQLGISRAYQRFFQLPEGVRALLVGGVSFGADTLTLFVLKEFAHFHYLLAAAISFILGSVISYILNTTFVFRYRKYDQRYKEFILFFCIGSLGLGLHELCLWALTDGLGLYYLLSKFATAVVLFLWNYLVRKWVLFYDRRSSINSNVIEPPKASTRDQ